MKRLFPALLLLIAAFAAHAQTTLRIAAAADLTPVLPPILTEFEHTTGIHVEATFQASAMLTTQIQNGAPFDVFLSADLGYPKKLIDAGLADATLDPFRRKPDLHAEREGALGLQRNGDGRLSDAPAQRRFAAQQAIGLQPVHDR